jgi:hypothetical protein
MSDVGRTRVAERAPSPHRAKRSQK